jgi:hypothetical protein
MISELTKSEMVVKAKIRTEFARYYFCRYLFYYVLNYQILCCLNQSI